MNDRHGRILLAFAAAAAAFAAFVWWTGGIDTRLAGVALRSRSWERPAAVAALLTAAGALAARRTIVAAVPRVAGARDVLPWAAATLAGVLALGWGTWAVGGADSYGYVSQASLIAHGHLTDDTRAAPGFDWPDAAMTLMPLGYRLGRTPDRLAPIYPPGLPLMMAPFAAVSASAVFLLVPIAAAAAVLVVWRLGVRCGEAAAGVWASVLLVVSPTFLYQSVQPMSDVPVTACWLGALLLASHRAVWAPPAAGLVASLAVLIRPNLAPLVLIVVAVAGLVPGSRGMRRAVHCAVAVLPGAAALAAIQNVRYGAWLSSGYGSFGELFSLAYIAPNLARYPRWLVELHTPFVWLWLAAPIWIVTLKDDGRRLAWLLYAFAIAVVAAYLPYLYFQPDEWFYTRFLLPALPLMLLLGVVTIRRAAARIVPPPIAATVTAAIVLAVAVWCASTARSLGVAEFRDAERKYPAAGSFVRRRLPPDAMILAMQHSGSLRYYSGRQTLRWDLLDRAWLDRAVASLRRSGRQPFAVLDPDEDAAFRARFAGQESVERMVAIGQVGSTRIYELH